MYVPSAHGALCDRCPLNKQTPVEPTKRSPASLVIVGEAPGKNEVLQGEPFVGASGNKLNKYLELYKHARNSCHLTNALLCKPDRKLLPEEWKRALECCRPRLGAELRAIEGKRTLLLFGARALQSVAGRSNIKAWHGAPMWLPEFSTYAVCTFHPAFAMRAKPAMFPVIRRMVGRAVAMANGALHRRIDELAKIVIDPGPEMVAALQKLRSAPTVGVDVESAGLDPMTSPLVCIGVGTATLSVSVPKQAFGGPEGAELRALLASASPNKVMHNGQHDMLALEAAGFPVCGYTDDTLLLHSILASQLPHDLQFVASCETDYEAWKSEFHVTSDLKGAKIFADSPIHKLQTYNAKDVIGTVASFESMRRKLPAFHQGPQLYSDLLGLNDIALRMRRLGVLASPPAMEEHRVVLTERMAKATKEFADIYPDVRLGKVGMHADLKLLFFKRFGCTPLAYSDKTNGPKLDSFTLKEYTRLPDERIRKAADIILQFRKAAKLLTTYIDGLPMDDHQVVHATWKPWGTITGRWASAGPNLQNQPKIMRNIFIPRPGYVFVSADYSQLELRIVALLSGCENLLRLFAQGVDIHQAVAEQSFGEICKTLPNARNAAKVLEYGLCYGGEANTIYGQLAPKFPDLRFDTVAKAFKKLLTDNPEIRAGQAANLRLAHKLGYVEERLSGRREYFHDGMVEPTKVYNFPVQSMAGTLINRALLNIEKEIDWDSVRVVFQVHDELVLECRNPDVGIALLKKHMQQEVTVDGRTMLFPIDASIHTSNWRDKKGVV